MAAKKKTTPAPATKKSKGKTRKRIVASFVARREQWREDDKRRDAARRALFLEIMSTLKDEHARAMVAAAYFRGESYR
jgi:hypothetical protein